MFGFSIAVSAERVVKNGINMGVDCCFDGLDRFKSSLNKSIKILNDASKFFYDDIFRINKVLTEIEKLEEITEIIRKKIANEILK